MGDDDGVHDYDGGLTEDEDDPYRFHDKTKDKRNSDCSTVRSE